MGLEVYFVHYLELDLGFVLVAGLEWGHLAVCFEDLSRLHTFEIEIWLLYFLQSTQFNLVLGWDPDHWYLELSTTN